MNSLRPETGFFKCSQRTKTRKETKAKKKKVLCHNCNQPGHYSSRCTEPRKENQKGAETNQMSRLKQEINKIAEWVNELMNKSDFWDRV